MKIKIFVVAILSILLSGYFSVWLNCGEMAGTYAYGGGTQQEKFPQTITTEYFADLAKQKIEQALAQKGETRHYELKLVRAPQTMHLPAGKLICEVDLTAGVRYDANVPVAIRAYINDKFYRQAVCYYKVQIIDKVVVAAHDLAIDKPIAAADVRLEERQVDQAANNYLTSLEALAGRVPNRVIRSGTPLTNGMLQNPVVMESGVPITIITNYNGVEVKTEGVTMQKGRLNAMIRVRNTRSGKLLRGKVVDASTVEIIN